MSHNESGVLSKYNSLLDKNLNGYFSNTKMRKHLIKSGLINKDGRITGENSYRMKMAKKEHRDNVRDLLASAIVDKALDMERMRQYEIRKRLEELYKIELVQKVRSERGKRINDDLVALLTPRKKKSGKQRKSKSAAVTKAEKKDMKLPKIHFNERTKKLYYENADSTNSNDSVSLADHSQPVSASDKKILHPHPPTGKSKIKKKRKIHRGLMLAKSDQMVAHRVQLQSMAEVTMKYLGCPLNLTNDIFPSNKLSEIQIIQQHCGASTICVFRELLPANTVFTFVSRRHRGSPFGLTIYINGIQNIRISSCCEYKHKPGYKVGGKNSQFGLIAVQGAAPCYRCQIRLNLINDNKEAENEDQHSTSDEESAVKSYDIIVSRAGRHSESKLSRPISASVMTQTSDTKHGDHDHGEDKKEEEKVEEKYEYADDDFEEDEQFALNQTELTSDNEVLSSSQSSSSDSDDKKDPEDDHSYSISKSSDSDSGNEEKSAYKQEEENENDIEHQVPDTDNLSSGNKESAEYESSSENEKLRESEEFNEIEESTETSDSAVEKGNINDDGINIEKDLSDDSDHESTLSVSSKSSVGSSSNSENSKDDNEIKHDSDKDEYGDYTKNDSDENTDSVIYDEEENSKDDENKIKDTETDIIHQDDDSDNEVIDTSDGSDTESPNNTNYNVDDIKEINEDDNIGDTEIQNEEAEYERKPSNSNVEDTDKVVEEGEGTNDESDNNDLEKTASAISRESTMLTGNEDGRCDSANKTIQFNEEVDVVHYDKADVTSTEEETPRSDDSEAEFETVQIAGGNIILANLSDDSGDVDVNLENFEKETENITPHSVEDWAENVKVYSDEDEGDESGNTKDAVYKEGSINSFVVNWKDVELANIALTKYQTEEFLSSFEENKDAIVSLSLRNTIIFGGIEKLKGCVKKATNLKVLNLIATDIGPGKVEHLVEILLEGTQQLTTLMLTGNHLGDEGVSILTSALRRMEALKTLALEDCQIGDDGAAALCDYLSENPSLTSLRLSNNEFNLEGWRYICNALKVNDTLTALYVDYNNMGDDGVKLLTKGIIQNKSLITIAIEGNHLKDEGGESLHEAIEKCKTLINVTIMPKNSFSTKMKEKLWELIEIKNS